MRPSTGVLHAATGFREETSFNGLGTDTRFLAGNNDSGRTERLDRKRLRTLDPIELTCTERPLKGWPPPGASRCRFPRRDSPRARSRSNFEPARARAHATEFMGTMGGSDRTIVIPPRRARPRARGDVASGVADFFVEKRADGTLK